MIFHNKHSAKLDSGGSLFDDLTETY